MSDIIRIQPAPDRRQDFARWAVTQRPKIRTVSPSEFGVPSRLFTQAPEHVLIGALVDGHRYVSPEEDAADRRPEPDAPELLGVATPEALTSPDAPAEAADEPQDAEASDRSDSPPEEPQEESAPYVCDVCDREFTTARGRDTHRRLAHRED